MSRTLKCQAANPSACTDPNCPERRGHAMAVNNAIQSNDINAYLEARLKEEESLKTKMYNGRFKNGTLQTSNGSKSLEDPNNTQDVYNWENEERNSTYPNNLDSYVYPNREVMIDKLNNISVDIDGESYNIRRLLKDTLTPPWKAVEIFSRPVKGQAPTPSDIKERVTCAIAAHRIQEKAFKSSQITFSPLTPKRKKMETYNEVANSMEKDLNVFKSSLQNMTNREGEVPKREMEQLLGLEATINKLRNFV